MLKWTRAQQPVQDRVPSDKDMPLAPVVQSMRVRRSGPWIVFLAALLTACAGGGDGVSADGPGLGDSSEDAGLGDSSEDAGRDDFHLADYQEALVCDDDVAEIVRDLAADDSHAEPDQWSETRCWYGAYYDSNVRYGWVDLHTSATMILSEDGTCARENGTGYLSGHNGPVLACEGAIGDDDFFEMKGLGPDGTAHNTKPVAWRAVAINDSQYLTVELIMSDDATVAWAKDATEAVLRASFDGLAASAT